MMTSEKYTPDEIREMIPLYLNQTLTKEQVHGFEESIRSYPDLQKELNEFSQIRSVYQEMENETAPAPDHVFDRIMKNIETEAKPPVTEPGPRVFDTILASVGRWFRSPKVAWAVAAVQIILIAVILVSGPMKHEYRTSSSGQATSESEARINIVFKKEAKEGDIRAVLQKIGANIVSGPSAQGRYTIAIRYKKDVDSVLKTLKKADIIRFAEKAY
jgi:hypothetical protein